MHQFDNNSKLLKTQKCPPIEIGLKNMIYHANRMKCNYLNNVGEIYLMT